MLGSQLEFIFTKCLQKEKNITFFFKDQPFNPTPKIIENKVCKAWSLGRQGQVES